MTLAYTPRPSSTQTAACVACDAPLPAAAWVRLPYWALYRCPSCRSLTALPRPPESAQQELHGDEAYFEHPYFESRRLPEHVRQRCREVWGRISEASGRELPAGARHLDVGCDTGEFLLAAKDLYGTVPVGVEVAPLAGEQARAKGIEMHVQPVESLPDAVGRFDLITAIDLIEHLAEPAPFLQAARRLLADGGLLYLETPNPASLVYGLGRRLTNLSGARPAWICQRIFLREHIQYFTPEGLRGAAQAAGLQPVTLQTRRLPGHDISASAAVRMAMDVMQALDRPAAGSAILTWGVFTAA